jgi:hypothetical protein
MSNLFAVSSVPKILVPELEAELTRRFGTAKYSDVLDKMRAHGLISNSRPAGRGKSNYYLSNEAEHIYRVFEVRQQLPSGVEYTALAFAMAANGITSTFSNAKRYIDNVAIFIETCINDFTESNEEVIGAAASAGRADVQNQPTPPEVLKARRATAHVLSKFGLQRSAQTENTFQQIELVFEMLIGIYLFDRLVSSYTNRLRNLGAPQDLGEFLKELVPRLRPSGIENPLVAAVRQARTESTDLLFVGAKDALLLRSGFNELLSDCEMGSALSIWSITEPISALLTAVSIELQLENSAHPGLQALRDGTMFLEINARVNTFLSQFTTGEQI